MILTQLTGSWSGSLKEKKVVELHSNHTVIGYARYPGVPMRVIIPKLADALGKITKPDPTKSDKFIAAKKARDAKNSSILKHCQSSLDSPITHDWFWPRFGKFFNTGDVILTETGTSSFGILVSNMMNRQILLTSYRMLLYQTRPQPSHKCFGAPLDTHCQPL